MMDQADGGRGDRGDDNNQEDVRVRADEPLNDQHDDRFPDDDDIFLLGKFAVSWIMHE